MDGFPERNLFTPIGFGENGKEGGVEKYRLFEKQLNGKFIFIQGNHDNNNSLKTIITKLYIYHGSKNICMTHRPEHADPFVPLNFCGHVHGRYKVKRLSDDSLIINFPVDVWNYYPVSFNQINSCVAEFLRQEKQQINWKAIQQYFEKTAQGVRYINLSRFAGTSSSEASPDEVEFKGRYISWKPELTELYLFQNVDINKEKIFIIAPHPDDAEIATFGLYDHRDAYIVTITAGEDGKPRFKRFFPDKREHALFQGMVRTEDSITVPFWGGLMPERCVNLGYFDGTLEEMFKNPTRAVASVAGTEDLSTFRKYNLSHLAAQEIPLPTWNALVEDLSRLITLIQPTVIVTPNPLTDSHPDHQFSTIALLEAIQKSGLKTGSLYLYTVHNAHSSRWPFGKATSVVSLPPYFSKHPFFDKIYSYHLSQESFTRKLFALDDMHGFRPVYFLTSDKYSENFPIIIQSVYLQWKTISQARKYLRDDELFFVLPVQKAGWLKEEFLRNSPRIFKKKACSHEF